MAQYKKGRIVMGKDDKALSKASLELTQRIQTHFPRNLDPKILQSWNGCPNGILKKILRDVFSKTDLIFRVAPISSFFNESSPVKLSFSKNFKNLILSEISELVDFPEPPESVRHVLSGSKNDKEVILEYAIKHYSSVAELSLVIYEKIMKQSKGENGELQNNGRANIFYVPLKNGQVVVIDIRWDSDNHRWCLIAFESGENIWIDGSYVFSRSSDTFLRPMKL